MCVEKEENLKKEYDTAYKSYRIIDDILLLFSQDQNYINHIQNKNYKDAFKCLINQYLKKKFNFYGDFRTSKKKMVLSYSTS